MANEQLLAANLRDALLTRFNAYDDLNSRIHADTEEWAGPMIEMPDGSKECISVGDNVAGDRLVWLRLDSAGVKEFVVYIQMGGEGEIVVQAINKMEETIRRSHRTDWEEVDRLYSVALAWATAREVNNKAHRCTVLHNSASQTHVLRYTEVLEELAHCDLGTTVEEVERSLRAGVYIGLNMAHYRTGSGPLLCCFVGDEWAAQVQKLCSANACTHLVRPELLPLPDDRIGWLLPSPMRAGSRCPSWGAPRTPSSGFGCHLRGRMVGRAARVGWRGRGGRACGGRVCEWAPVRATHLSDA